MDNARGVVRGAENLSSQVVCLCMAVFVCNICVYQKEKETNLKRCVYVCVFGHV